MPTLDSQILAVFLTRIGESDRVDNSLVQELGDMLSNDKLPGAEDLVQLYATCSGGTTHDPGRGDPCRGLPGDPPA
jgi:hypothetical protein